MGERGLGPSIEADDNQQEQGLTNIEAHQHGPESSNTITNTIGEVHHHPVSKSNKNGSSPGYLKVKHSISYRYVC